MPECDSGAQSERYFLAIANAAGDIIHFNNAEDPIREEETKSLPGYGPDKLSGQPTLDIIHPADRGIVLDAMASTFTGSAPLACTIRMIEKDGTLIDAQMSTFYFDMNGQGRVGAVLRYISGKKTIAKESEKNHNLHQEFESDCHQVPTNTVEKSLADSGIIPICMYCNKIRNQSGAWMHLATYFKALTNADLSHGICPECIRTRHPGFIQKKGPTDKSK